MKKVCGALVLFCISSSVFPQHRQSKDSRHAPLERKWQAAYADQREPIDPVGIDIVRDAYGVPHIFARTDREVAYGLAWAHAEDDFETIQKAMLASKSMLGQFLGKEGASVDYVVQWLGIQALVNERYEKDIASDFKGVLSGYCDGLNAYAENYPKAVLEKKAFPVTPQDLLVYSVLQLVLGSGLEDAVKEITEGTLPLIDWAPAGSNAFALNSAKTADGDVYLVINTHHPLEGQVAWYEAHLASEEGWNILGALFPASPIILTGFNKNLGWTHTVNHPDRLDIYQLQTDPENPLAYQVDGVWHTLEEKTIKLKVKLSAINVTVKKKAYKSIYGPTLVTAEGAFSIRTGAMMDIRGLEQWYRMNKANNFSEFRDALAMEAHPSYNIVYGDRYDTIFYLSNGKIPVRQPGFEWDKILPGNTAKTLWTKFHPVENLPQVLNPPSGYVFNVNHAPFKATAPDCNIHAADYDADMGYETHDNNRSLRVMELMQQHPKVSYEDFKRIKYDLQLPRQLAYPVNIDTLFMLDAHRYPELTALIGMLRDWDRNATVSSHEATVFAVSLYYIDEMYKRDKSLKALDEATCTAVLDHTKHYLLKYFGTLEVPLGEYQRLVRGDKSLPLAGIPGVLATMYSKPIGDGRVKGTIGDCYIAFARYAPEGPEIETVNCYGASNRKNDPHYHDQMALYQRQQTKKMTLDKAEVYRQAEKIYHPEALSKVRISEKMLDADR